jgi:hypothetical protein
VAGSKILGFGNLGTGRSARFNRFLHGHSVLKGARFILRRPAADAVALAVAQLVAQGFVAREDNLDVQLKQSGSHWLARAVEIGGKKVSWGESVVDYVLGDTALDIVLRPRISHTLVMVAARELPDGMTELHVFPHMSLTGRPGSYAGAESRLRASLEAVSATGTADGTLVSYKRSLGIPNDGSPASQQMVETLLGWR